MWCEPREGEVTFQPHRSSGLGVRLGLRTDIPTKAYLEEEGIAVLDGSPTHSVLRVDKVHPGGLVCVKNAVVASIPEVAWQQLMEQDSSD